MPRKALQIEFHLSFQYLFFLGAENGVDLLHVIVRDLLNFLLSAKLFVFGYLFVFFEIFYLLIYVTSDVSHGNLGFLGSFLHHLDKIRGGARR